MAKFGFIGMGNMGYAMLKGMLKEIHASELLFTALHEDKMKQVSEETGVAYVTDNAACAKAAEYVILAVKPQYYEAVITEIKEEITPEKIIISIAPGFSIAKLTEMFGEGSRVVRAMPNTPALIGEGMTGITYRKELYTPGEEKTIEAFFSSFGKSVFVEERMMDAVVCASGSSPAFVYMFIEALADSAVRYGLPRAAAYEMAAQAVAGSAKMVLETGKHPGELKDNVCSPGGTTIAGVAALEEYGLRNAVMKAAEACYNMCTGMKK